MGSESWFGFRFRKRNLMTESLLLKSWYDSFWARISYYVQCHSVLVGPDRSLNQVKLSHAIIYHDNSKKPFMSTPLFQMFRLALGKTQKVCKGCCPSPFFKWFKIHFWKKWTQHPSNVDPDPVSSISYQCLY